MTPSFKSPLSKLAMAAFAFGSLVATTGAAQAEGEGGHFGGGGHFSGGGGFHGSVHVSGGGGFHASGGVRMGGHYARPAFHGGYGYRGGGWGVHGGFHVGWGYYPRYYYPYSYYYGVPSYYNEGYYPVQPTAAVYAPAAIAPRPELPRFGIGVFGGSSSINDESGRSTPDSSDMGLLARLRLTPGLILEGELGNSRLAQSTDDRVDRRLGASLIYEFGAYNHFAPYVLAGLGVQQASVDGTYSTTQDFGEIGVGLRYALTPHLHITADVRAGTRASVSNDDSMNTLSGTARSIAPPTSTSGDSESYTRGQVAAIVYF